MDIRYSLLTAATASLAAFAPQAWCGKAPIETDRPDFVESSSTVAPRHFQIEASSEWLAHTSERATPSLLRIGLVKDLELRAESDGFVSDGTESGFADLSVGLKLHVGDEEDLISKAWLLHVDLPTGDAAVRQPGIRPSLRYVAEFELPHDFSLGLMPGIAWDNDDNQQRRVGGILGIVLGRSLGERVRSFMEVGLERIAVTRDDHTIGSLNTGLVLLLGPDIQLDGSIRLGLTPDTPDVIGAIGLSARW